jgi:radical SAM protein with 4Fe4S-binding SPASM domain
MNIMDLFNVIGIETVNLCTRRCWHCKYGQKRPNGDVQWLSTELIEKVAENLQALNFRGRISPFGINEPLLDRRMPEIIRLLRSACPEALITLVSNGDLLTPQTFPDLFEAGLDGLGLSIYDGQSFNRLKSYWKNPKMRLMDMRHFPWENRGGQIKRGKFFGPIDQTCLRPFHEIVVKSNGDVVLCCADMYGDVVMGNVAENRLEDIWNSAKFSEYRCRLAANTRKGLPLCETCSYEGWSNALTFPFHIPARSPLHISLRHIYNRLNMLFPGNYIDFALRKILSNFKTTDKGLS